MKLLKRLLFLKLRRHESGATAVEYAVMLALILLALLASISTVGVGTGGIWSNNSSEIDTAFGS